MREEIQALLADWDELTRRWEAAGGAGFVFDALDARGDWLARSGSLIFPDWEHAGAVVRDYDRLRGALPPNTRDQLDAFLGAFFWGDAPRRDLHLPEADEFLVLMSPESVAELLELWRAIDLGPLRQVLPKLDPPGAVPFHKDFPKGFRRYVEQWGDLLDEAEEDGRGIVVYRA
jgi:hypothetical protein